MNDDRCHETVYPRDRARSFHPHCCSRKAVKDGFCKQHSPAKQKEKEAGWKRESVIRDLEYDLEEAAAAIVKVAIKRRVECLPKIAKAVDGYLAVKAKLDAARQEAAK